MASIDISPFAGRSGIVNWSKEGQGMIRPRPGNRAVGRLGISVSQMRSLTVGRYLGELYDGNVAPIVLTKQQLLPALWAYCESGQFQREVRKVDQKMNVTNGTSSSSTFRSDQMGDIATKSSRTACPNRRVTTQHSGSSTAARGVNRHAPGRRCAAAGLPWPAELDDKMHLSKRARALVKRCEELPNLPTMTALFAFHRCAARNPLPSDCSDCWPQRVLSRQRCANSQGEPTLDDWLRNNFFEEHCKLFHERPFVWHIWDGRKRDGFHALVNYHKLCEGKGKGRKLLESLTYSYLGDWITRQKDEVKRGEGGAEDRLAAALELQNRLEAILQGEPPFDIFVRWKPCPAAYRLGAGHQ